MIPQAKPAAWDAAGRNSFRPISLFLLCFLCPSDLRRVVGIVFRFSGLELRDWFLADECDGTRYAGKLVADATLLSWMTDSELACVTGAGRPGIGGGRDKSV
jgi:hypothetical protein